MARLIAYECEDTDHGSCRTTHTAAAAKTEELILLCGFYCRLCVRCFVARRAFTDHYVRL